MTQMPESAVTEDSVAIQWQHDRGDPVVIRRSTEKVAGPFWLEALNLLSASATLIPRLAALAGCSVYRSWVLRPTLSVQTPGRTDEHTDLYIATCTLFTAGNHLS